MTPAPGPSPTGHVLGVDGCPGGWVGVLLTPAGPPQVWVAPTVAGLLERTGPVDGVGVDIPIGLPGTTVRAADLAARAALGPRRMSIFLTPVRSAVFAVGFDAANRAQRAAIGQGLSRQAWGLCERIAEVDAWVGPASAAGLVVAEVHPELSFATLASLLGAASPLAHGKKTWAGAAERRALLGGAGIVMADALGPDPGRAGVDDVLDAAVAAWSLRRVLAGRAVRYGDQTAAIHA